MVNVSIVLAEDAVSALEVETATADFAAKHSLVVQDRTDLPTTEPGLTPSMNNEPSFLPAFECLDVFEHLIVEAWIARILDQGRPESLEPIELAEKCAMCRSRHAVTGRPAPHALTARPDGDTRPDSRREQVGVLGSCDHP